MSNVKISVLGEGHFGTAIASVLANNCHEVRLWCYDEEIATEINETKINSKYFPEHNLNQNITATNDLYEAVKDTDFIFEAIPVKYLRSVIENLKKYIKDKQTIICLSKGIEDQTLLFPTQIVQEILPNVQVAAISGPSFAKELMEEILTGVNLASISSDLSERIKNLLENEYFRIKIIDDILGLQVCGALKNVITIGIGIAQGANFADDTIAYLFTKGLSEISLLIKNLNGNKKTAYDFAGVGDLVLCAFGKSSRNLWFGQEIGKGKKIDEILKNNITVEGLNTLKSIKQLSSNLELDLSFCSAIYQIVFENKNFDILFF